MVGVEDKSSTAISPQVGDKIIEDIVSVPWGHHKLLIDKFKKTPDKALFFVRKTIENGWSRDMLLNFIFRCPTGCPVGGLPSLSRQLSMVIYFLLFLSVVDECRHNCNISFSLYISFSILFCGALAGALVGASVGALAGALCEH